MVFNERHLSQNENSNIFVGTFKSSLGSESIYYKRSVPKNIRNFEQGLNLFIIHGAIEHHERHLLLPAYLQEKIPNLIITWIDLKGHGQSGGKRSHINDFSEYILDVISLLNHEWSIEKMIPIKNFLLGHSMGGLICLKTIIEYKSFIDKEIKGLILSNPFLGPALKCNKLIKNSLLKIKNIDPRIRIPSIYKGSDLCRDAFWIRKFQSDQLISSSISLNLLKEIIYNGEQMRRLSYFVTTSCLFLLSGDDKVVDNSLCQSFYYGLNKNLRDLKLYKDRKHELLNDIGREEVFKEIYSWILAKMV